MAVAFDAVGPSAAGYFSGTTLTTSGSWKHTCTGTNLLLLVDVGIGNNPDTGLGVNVSYGGQSMTQVALLHSGGITRGFLARFKLVNPAAGTNVVSVSITGGKGTITGGSMSFNGADQVTGVAATTYDATGNSTTATVAVTSNTSGNIIASAAACGHSNRAIGSGGTRTFSVNGTLQYYASNVQAGTWAATGSSVTTSFSFAAATAGDEWAIISNEVLSASQGTIVLPTANLQLAAPALSVNPDTYPQWFGAVSRAPLVSFAGAPSLAPVQISVSNTAGYWMFAVVSWRQDAGVPGVLQYPSTVNISDDAGNFWVPLQPGAHGTGIVRCAIWMAPAARTATQVTISPSSTAAGDAYQSAMVVNIFEYPADCPWYEIEETEFGYVNQGSSLTVTQTNTTTGLFSVGVVAYDNFAMPVTVTSSGWTQLYAQGGDNFVDHTGDLQEFPFFATTAGSPLSLMIARSSGGNVADLAGVIITVHGVTDAIPFPYAMPDAENWPVLITETGTGPVINANPDMLNGTADWSVDGGGSFGALTAVTWPAFQPYPNYQALITPSIAMTPSGTQNTCTLESELEPVSTALRYTTLAYVYSEAGFSTVAPQIEWYDNTSTLITTSLGNAVTVPTGSWTQLSFPNGVYPPANAVYGTASVVMSGLGSAVPASSVLYVGYCGLGVADSYENVPPDDIAWTDLSSRNFTQGEIEISRGIQYEQQSLEAGTMTVYLTNNDGAMMFGNVLSSYWPNAGDTDVPIRLRAVWPQSLTPYYVLFSGFTDQISFGWNEEDLYAYAAIEASDAWSRLTSQMLDAGLQEVLEDSPVLFCPCSLSGTNIALGNVTPVISLPSAFASGAVSATFSSNAIALPGLASESCWATAGSGTTSASANQGIGLTYFPAAAESLPPVAGGVTASWWFSPVSNAQGSQPATQLTVATCYSGTGPMWTIYIDNSGTAANTFAYITVYDQVTGNATSTVLGGTTYFIAGATASTTLGTYYVSVTFTQTSLTAQIIFGNGTDVALVAGNATVAANLAPTIAGFSLGGNAGPLYATNVGGTLGFWNVAIQNVAVFEGIVPPARIAAHVQTAAIAWTSEPDTSRLARVLGYAGATPVILQAPSYGYGLAASGTTYGAFTSTADEDPVTAITDTNGQVTSSYFTNIASSTLAFMFVNGPGVLVYRRRLNEYDRALTQWVIGENAAIPLNPNTFGQSSSVANWLQDNGATLVPASLPSVSPQFLFCGLFHGNGVTANPQIQSFNVAVTPGVTYNLSALAYCPQGWTTGIQLQLIFFTSGGAGILPDQVSPVTPLAAGSLTYLTTGPVQAPQNAARMKLTLEVSGTPASTVQFYVTDVTGWSQAPVTAGGAGATAPEVPALVSAKLSSDRALMFNQAILTQFGTGEQTTYSGTSLNFQPTSGVLVTIQNNASVLARAGVPYTATLYLQNSVQAPPYYMNEPSMEDFGNWITNTLAAPLLRPDTVTITPVATPQAMQMALQAEIGDTSTFRKRTPSAPEIQILTYISKLTHAIDLEHAKWETSYELSPFPAGVVLACDDVIHGTLTGGNLLGF